MAFGGSDNNIDITVKVDAKGAITTLDQLGNEVKKVGDETSKAGKPLNDYKASIASLAKSCLPAITAVGAITAAFKLVGPEAIRAGSRLLDLEESFNRLSREGGASAEALSRDFGAALGDTIPKSEQLRLANELMLSGMDPARITDAAKAARTLGEMTGGSATEGIEKMKNALLRGNVEMLKRIGIHIDSNKILREYIRAQGVAEESISKVVSALDDETKRAILLNPTLDELTKFTKKHGEVSNDAGDNVDKFASMLTNVKEEAYKTVASNAALNQALKDLSTVNAVGALNSLVTALSTVVAVATEAIAILAKLSDMPKADNLAVSVNSKSLLEIQAQIKYINNLLAKDSPESIEKAKRAYGGLANQLNKLKSNVYGQTAIATTGLAQIFDKLGEKIQKQSGIVVKQNKIQQDTAKATADAIKNTYTAIKAEESAAKAKAYSAKQSEENKRKLEEETRALEEYKKGVSKTFGNLGPLKKWKDELQATWDQRAINGGQWLEEQWYKIGEAAHEAGLDFKDIEELYREIIEASKDLAEQEAEAAKKRREQTDEQKKQLADQKKRTREEWEQIGAQAVDGFNRGLSEGFNRQDWANLINDTMGDIGAQIGSAFGPIGAAVGDLIFTQISKAITDVFMSSSPSEEERKAVDKYFAELFEANRITAVINGELKTISDLTFKNPTNEANFEAMTADAKATFGAIGAIYEQVLNEAGVKTKHIVGQLAQVFANNLGGSIENLRILIKATGKSIEELGEAAQKAFLAGKLSAEEYLVALSKLTQVTSPGIVDAVGDIKTAFDRFEAAGSKGGAAMVDALQSIGVEASEAGVSIDSLGNFMIDKLGYSAQQVSAFIAAMAASGINSLEQLKNASAEVAAAVIANYNALMAGQAASYRPISIPRPSTNSGGGASSRSAADDAKKKAKEARKDMLKDVYDLAKASAMYAEIMEKLENKIISQSQASKELKALYKDIAKEVKAVEKLEAQAAKEMEKFGFVTLKTSKALDEHNKRLENLTRPQEEVNQGIEKSITYNKALAEFYDKYRGNLEMLTLAASAAGISFEDLQKKSIEAFLAGTKTATEAFKEMQNVLPGIADQTGAAGEAFRRMLEAGENGGAVTLNFLKGIAFEVKELGGKTLEDAVQALVGQGISPDLAGKFLAGLKDAGITTLDDLAEASNTMGIEILSILKELGLPFEVTSAKTKQVLDELSAIPKSIDIELRFTSKIDEALRDFFEQFGIVIPNINSQPSTPVTPVAENRGTTDAQGTAVIDEALKNRVATRIRYLTKLGNRKADLKELKTRYAGMFPDLFQ